MLLSRGGMVFFILEEWMACPLISPCERIADRK